MCDCVQVGYDLKEEIERKFDKWQEPPPVKQVKPLPAPLDGQRKKRGGRRWDPLLSLPLPFSLSLVNHWGESS